MKTYRNTKNGSFQDAIGFVVQNSVVGDIYSLTDAQYAKFSHSFELVDKWQQAFGASVVSEAKTSSNATTVTVDGNIYKVSGVYLATDTLKTGTNYYTGGSFSAKVITLGVALPGATTNVIVDYEGDTRRQLTTGGAVAYTKDMSEFCGSVDKSIKVTYTIAGATMPAGTTVVLTLKDAAGNTLETKTRTLAQQTIGSGIIYIKPSCLEHAATMTVSGTTVQGSGNAYTIAMKLEAIDYDDHANGATFSVGTEGSNKIIVTVQLLKDGAALSGKSDIVQMYLSSDDRGLTAVDGAEGFAISSKGTLIAKNCHTFTGATPIMSYTGVIAESDTDGIITLEIEDTTGTTTHFLNVIFNDGTRAISDAIYFA